MSATDTITVGEALPKLASVEPANGPFSVSVTWAAGSRVGRTDIVDLAPMIFTFKVFKPLRDNPELFRSVQLAEWGVSLVWPDNADLDVGAESVEEMAEEAMTNSDFAEFLKRTGFTLDAAAAQLGIARRLVAYYAKDRQIPRYIALACRQLETERSVSEPRGDAFFAGVPAPISTHAHAAAGRGPDDFGSLLSHVRRIIDGDKERGTPAFSGHDMLLVGMHDDTSGSPLRIDPVTGSPIPAAGVIRSRRESR